MEILVIGFIVLLVGGFLYSVNGGAGRIAASTRLPPPTRPTLPRGQPSGNISSIAYGPPSTAGAGFSKPENLNAIDAYFGNDLNVVTVSMTQLVPGLVSHASLRRQATHIVDKIALLKKALGKDNAIIAEIGDIQERFLERRLEQAFEEASFQRTLQTMTDAERATLRLAEMLFALGELTPAEHLQIQVPIVWNQGQCLITGAEAFNSADRLDAFREGVSTLFRGHLGEARTATERLQETLRKALLPGSKTSTADRAVLERYLFSGAHWLTPEAGAAVLTPTLPLRPSALRLGIIQGTGKELMFDRNESLITIGPPGTGKSQTLMRNLLTMDGGALVIDLKGELYDTTAADSDEAAPLFRDDCAPRIPG